MDDAPAADRPSVGHEVAVPGRAAPAMPQPDWEWLQGSRYMIPVANRRVALGWEKSKKDGPRFVLVRYGAMTGKVLERFPLTEEGWSRAWATLAGLDTEAAQLAADKLQELYAAAAARKSETERRTRVYEAFASATGVTRFSLLGVQVLAGESNVYTIGVQDAATKTNTSRLLGPLTGAQAMVTDGSQAWSPGRAMFMPIGLTGLATKTKADAAVVFADGTVHTSPLDGNYAVREAQKQVVQFNALAGAMAAAPASPAESDPATRLRKLQELLDAGLLSQEEYESKRAEIISQL